jgi:hypothetical protein
MLTSLSFLETKLLADVFSGPINISSGFAVRFPLMLLGPTQQKTVGTL